MTDLEPTAGRRDSLERAGVLLAARVAEHPFVRGMAQLGLRYQIAVSRSTRFLWRTLAVPTHDEVNQLRDDVARIRYRAEGLRRDGQR